MSGTGLSVLSIEILLCVCSPAQILNPIIGPVPIDMVYSSLPFWIWEKCLRNKSMNEGVKSRARTIEGDSFISKSDNTLPKHPGLSPDVSKGTHLILRKPGDYSPFLGHLI